MFMKIIIFLVKYSSYINQTIYYLVLLYIQYIRGILMKSDNRMDALDFVINTLLEHEKRLDVIIERLENITHNIEIVLSGEKIMQEII
jgi:hypothetical protein